MFIVPFITIRGKSQPPWFDSELKDMKKHKDALRKRTKDPDASSGDKEIFQAYELPYKKVFGKKRIHHFS